MSIFEVWFAFKNIIFKWVRGAINSRVLCLMTAHNPQRRQYVSNVGKNFINPFSQNSGNLWIDWFTPYSLRS